MPDQLSEDALRSECETLLKDFQVTDTQAINLEKMTRNQAGSSLWKRQRVGRITASIAHDVKTLKETTDPKLCLNKILKESQMDLSSIPSIRFGVVNEEKAKVQYSDAMKSEHGGFNIRDSGLVVDTTFPLFAASPDGVRTCECHGEGLVEVKCSYKHKDMHPADIPEIDAHFYLDADTLALRKSHRYFTQVQFQMYICEKQFCDFVVFTNKGIFCQTIYYDPDFVQEQEL